MRNGMLALYSSVHFLVDFACACFLFHCASAHELWPISVLVYNFCAFALQMPLGLLADRLNRNVLFASTGCIAVAASFTLSSIPLAFAAIAGIGNALFHIGGGVDVLNISDRKSAALGIFVSPGALGIYLGAMLGRNGVPIAAPLILILLAVAALMPILRHRAHAYPDNAPFSLQGASGAGVSIAVAACLSCVVALRGFEGLAFAPAWKGVGIFAPLLVCCAMAGKASGGFLADRFGFARVTGVSLGLAAILICFASFPATGLAAMLLFNMTMPITLWLLARVFPGAKGFSFGLLTFALFLGYLPVYLGANSFPLFGDTGLMAVSLALLAAALALGGFLRKSVRRADG